MCVLLILFASPSNLDEYYFLVPASSGCIGKTFSTYVWAQLFRVSGNLKWHSKPFSDPSLSLFSLAVDF